MKYSRVEVADGMNRGKSSVRADLCARLEGGREGGREERSSMSGHYLDVFIVKTVNAYKLQLL